MADSRFSALSSDPRYRLPNKKESRTAVDPRFKRLFTDQDFRKKARVDKYGRKINPESGKKELEKAYRLDKGQDRVTSKSKRDVVESSDEQSEASDEEEEVVERRDPAREGGFAESSSEEESDSAEESEDEAELAEETAGQEQTEDIPLGEVSRRIAAVNLDWDHIRATDIMAVASSFVPAEGGIESVTVYPSEFGRERLEREELEGPPREIFASSKRGRIGAEQDEDSEGESEDDEDIKRRLQEDQVNEGEEFDTAKLRQYQLERLRYYYAVISCNTKFTAKALYDSMDGREYLTTANFFDLRFIPDDTTFDDERPTDECTSLPDGYQPNDFRTEALTHSKVRLTWDDDDTTRKEIQKRAFSRAEMDENDLQAYIGSDSSDAESVTSRKSAAEDRKTKKKEAKKSSMRAALGLAEAPSKKAAQSRAENVGDMQITFTSGLAEKGQGVFENEPQDEESTRDRYVRKERERKQKRKEKMKAARPGAQAGEADVESDESGDEDQGFDDPFFNDPSAAKAAEKKAKKEERKKKHAASAAQDEEAAKRKAELGLLMAQDQDDNVRHFDMREIEKSEKKKGKKSKKDKKKLSDADVEDAFKVETADPRFKALFESHEFAIDPTNPRFKGTEGMKALLEEGRKKRKFSDGADVDDKPEKSKKAATGGRDDDLKGLVARLQGEKKGKSK